MYDDRGIGAKVPLALKALSPSALGQETLAAAPKFPNTTDAASWSREFAQFASFRYGLPLPRYRITFASMDDHAGQVFDRLHECEIVIDQQYAGDIEVLGHVIAHELAHLTLNRAGVALDDHEANEQLTDSVAVLAGFGPILAAGKQRSKTHSSGSRRMRETTRIGYLAEAEIAWLMEVRGHIGGGSFWRRISIDRSRQEFCECPVCTTRLRLPDVEATIDIVCRECRVRQRVVLRRGSLLVVVVRAFWRQVRRAASRLTRA